jgi:SAM-dependent methyltransferase
MKDFIKGIWRLFQPIKKYGFKYPVRILGAYYKFYNNWHLYKTTGGKLSFRYVAPFLSFTNEDSQTGGGHYFYQDIWALKHLNVIKPDMLYDIGSRYDGFVGQATVICPVTSIDIRPPLIKLENFHFIEGDILKLPFTDNTIKTLSCLHTIEHIGLGRYGDEISSCGFVNSLLEIQRVVAPDGILILSMPVGLERIEFNAQRILNPLKCLDVLTNMELIEFSVIDEKDEFIKNADPADYINAKYCCGLYLFRKNTRK